MDIGFGFGETGKFGFTCDKANFVKRFLVNGKKRPDADIRAIIFSLGGPFPSEYESLEFVGIGDNIKVHFNGLSEPTENDYRGRTFA